MVNYKCFRCGYNNNDKTKMIKHLGRKRLCKPILNDVNIDDYKKESAITQNPRDSGIFRRAILKIWSL